MESYFNADNKNFDDIATSAEIKAAIKTFLQFFFYFALSDKRSLDNRTFFLLFPRQKLHCFELYFLVFVPELCRRLLEYFIEFNI